MTIRTILLHAPAGHGDPARGPAACALGAASALGARLTAAVFDADAFTGGPADAQRTPRAEDEVYSRAATETAERLIRAAADLGVEARAVTSRSFAYGLPEVVADHSRLHDLVVAGVDRAGLLSERSMAEHLVFESGRPLVIVPAGYRGPVRFERISVAWDNSRVAARALGDALPLLRRAQKVDVVSVGGERPVEASLNTSEVIDALARRGISARFEHIDPAGARVGEALGQHALHRGSDLLVMGAFGHSRLRQFVLGGATRSVLDDPRLPVLLSH
jgi:nucleotide-binding universal stress UspA family protein